MKQIHKKKGAVALGLALVMGLTPLAAASEAMGNEIQESAVVLNVGTGLTKHIFWSDTYSDLRTERYVTYTPNTSVTPTVVYGDKVISKATLTAMAKKLESQGRRVVGGVNGDLYVVATGAPLGMIVTEGKVRSVPGTDNEGYHAVGFRADGTAFIGRPQLATTVGFQGLTFPVGVGFNKIRTTVGNYVIYTPDFAKTTQNSKPGIDVILTPVLENLGEVINLDVTVQNTVESAEQPAAITEVRGSVVQSGELVVGGRVTYQVEQVLESTGAIPIPEGKIILSINNEADAYFLNPIKALVPGDRVTVDITTKESAWTEATQAMGGLYRLVTGGKVNSGLSTERTAYSAVGVKADGTAIFYTIDGKQPGYSVGSSLTQVAMRMAELGCVDAISLDGGGSTTLGATYPDGGNLGVVNKPSDGAERSNSVALFLTTEAKPVGDLAGLYVTPGEGLLLTGAQMQMKAQGLDSNYYATALTAPVVWAEDNADATVTDEGLFTAGTSGVTRVTATQGGVSGGVTLTVVSKPDKLTVVDAASGANVTSLAVDPNAKVDLQAIAGYKKLTLTSQDNCFIWSVDPTVGTIDSQGVFTAAGKSAAGNLTVSVGEMSLTIPVSVAGHVNTLESFERGIASFTAAGAGITLTGEKSADRVRYGSGSLRVGYDATAGGTPSLVTTLTCPAGEKFLNLWVYGDQSQNSLTATFADPQGTTTEVMVTGLEFSGWKYLELPIPDGATALRSVNLLYGDQNKTTGAFWLDQLTTSNERVSDTTPPVVSATVTGTQLTAKITDFMDKKFAAEQVSVTYDGAVLKHTLDSTNGTVKATLPAPDGKLHRVAVTASDASGNLGRGTVNVAAAAGVTPVFVDTETHWAQSYADYLYHRKVTNGVPGVAEGELLYQPDKAITRGELFSMMTRWLGLDAAKYADTKLPFADAGDIADWALPGVKAMYALGYLKGSATEDGTLYANAGADISRAEAMTLLGRVQAKGYAQTELTFADGGLVPDWAAAYVKTLVGQGIVSGAEGNMIFPNNPIKRGEVAKILFAMT